MPVHVHVPYLGQFIAFLLTVVVIVPVFKRIKISPVLGYLAVGAAIGPFALAWVPDVDAVRTVAEFGVVFLLFSIGLELSFARLRSYARLIFGLGSAQLLLTALIVAGIAWMWGNTPANAIIIGLCLAISSTAMVVPLLQERGEFATIPGRASFSVLLLQDLAVVPMLILLGVLGGQSEMGLGKSLGLALIKGALALILIIVVGRFALRYLFKKVMASHSVDVFMAMMLLAILATSMATAMAGLSLALGAFLAGLLLAETEYRHQIESEIEPFKGLLLGLFFMGVGMNLDVVLAFEHGLWVLASVLGLVVIKALVASVLARCFGLNWACAVRTGFLLAQAGEFAFVIIGQATLTYGLMEQGLGQFMVVVAGLSMAATPLVAYVGQRIAQQMAAVPQDQQAMVDIEAPHVVIAGFGRVGRAVASVLQRQEIAYVAVDMNTEAVDAARRRGESVILGDARKQELLKNVGIASAQALIITMDDPAAVQQTLLAIRRQWPDLPIFARSRDSAHSEELLEAGASAVVPETLEVSLQLASAALQSAGLSKEAALLCLEELRLKNPLQWQDIERS